MMSLPLPPELPVHAGVAPADPAVAADAADLAERSDILPRADEPRVPSPGELTAAWTAVFCAGWFAVMCGFAAVWASARTTGYPTWWLGSASEPRLVLVSLLPFVVPLVLVVEGLMHQRRLPLWGILGAGACSVVAILDLSHQPRYAAVEFLLAGGGLAVSVAAFAGMLRRAG